MARGDDTGDATIRAGLLRRQVNMDAGDEDPSKSEKPDDKNLGKFPLDLAMEGKNKQERSARDKILSEEIVERKTIASRDSYLRGKITYSALSQISLWQYLNLSEEGPSHLDDHFPKGAKQFHGEALHIAKQLSNDQLLDQTEISFLVFKNSGFSLKDEEAFSEAERLCRGDNDWQTFCNIAQLKAALHELGRREDLDQHITRHHPYFKRMYMSNESFLAIEKALENGIKKANKKYFNS